jgi:hypothetical protein
LTDGGGETKNYYVAGNLFGMDFRNAYVKAFMKELNGKNPCGEIC